VRKLRLKITFSLTLLVAFGGSLVSAPSHGTSFYPVPFPQEVQEAPVIVRGKTGMSYADWGKGASPDEVRRVYTYFELQIGEVLKGNVSGASLIMRELGGEKDGVGLHVPGAAHFGRGEEVVVFLKEKGPEGVHDVLGMMMGKYIIQTDPDGKEYLVGPGLSGNQAVHDDGNGTHGDAATHPKWTLNELRQLIQEQAASRNSPKNSKKANHLPDTQVSPAPSPSPRPSLNAAAPHLQTTEPDESPTSTSVFFYLTVGLGLLGLLGFLGFTRRKK